MGELYKSENEFDISFHLQVECMRVEGDVEFLTLGPVGLLIYLPTYHLTSTSRLLSWWPCTFPVKGTYEYLQPGECRLNLRVPAESTLTCELYLVTTHVYVHDSSTGWKK